ncbi:MAG: Rpn family recombination-promoting nuclease/putative transposase [Pirellula sp.]
MIEIDPTIDFACKMLLGDPSHSRLTIHFLNAVLRPQFPIVDVEYLNPFVGQEFELDKLAILDILARDDVGRRMNIEVQRTRPGWLRKRLTYYASSQLVEQIGEGDNYSKLRPSIGICILNTRLFRHFADYHQQFRLRTKAGLELTDCLEIHTLELPKYPRGSDNRNLADPLDQWMDFFRNALGSEPADLRMRLSSPIFDEAIGVLEMISRTPEQRRYYNARLKWELDENSRREAEAVARAESEARGEARGEAREKARGKLEQIHMLQSLLGEQPTGSEILEGMTLTAMDDVIAELQTKLRSRLE